jgi:hypothetical protein
MLLHLAAASDRAGRALAKTAGLGVVGPLPGPAPRPPMGLRQRLGGGLGWKGNLALGAGTIGAGLLLSKARRTQRPAEEHGPAVYGDRPLPMNVTPYGEPVT